ncbi:MAG: DUF1565 domain-containing protein, partial [Acidimicrobiia bacterium]
MVAAFSAGFGMLAGFALDSGGGTGASRSDRAGTASASPEPEAGAGRRPDTTVWHVSEGSAPDGDGSSERPFTTIAEALGRAAPGDEVSVGPGVYPGFSTVRSGEPDAPIVVKGAAAAIRGDEDHEGHLVEVLHDHITISG